MKRFFSIIGAVLFYLVMFPMLLVVFASTMAYASTSHLGSVIKFIPLFLLSYFVTWFTCKIVYRKASLYKTYICLILAALVVIICQYQESHKINPYLQPIKLTNPKFSDLKLTLENNFKSRMPAACAATFKLLPLSKMDKDAIDLATEMSWEVKLFSALNNSFKVKNFRNTCKNFKI
ncbi:MAG: hypothetical protein WCQ47_08490 [bacterium]